MRLYAGTSGFSYKAWKGSFYPEDLPDAEYLAYYSRALPAVEINSTFYRMPRSAVMEKWAETVPEGFRFVIKASRRITHRARLAEVEEQVGYLLRAVAHLGDHLGPLLFQLPPYFHRDVPRLRDFLAGLPEDCRAVLEFRHESWAKDEVRAELSSSGAALCTTDTEEGDLPPIVPTAGFGYFRLRHPDYAEEKLRALVERVREQSWSEVYVFLKHEDEGAAPRLARRLIDLFES